MVKMPGCVWFLLVPFLAKLAEGDHSNSTLVVVYGDFYNAEKCHHQNQENLGQIPKALQWIGNRTKEDLDIGKLLNFSFRNDLS